MSQCGAKRIRRTYARPGFHISGEVRFSAAVS
jgi:hypothetical protein